MSQVLTVGVGSHLTGAFTEAVGGDLVTLDAAQLDAAGGLLARIAEAGSPFVVVLGPDVPQDRAFPLAGRVDVALPGTSVVLVAEGGPELWVAAMRAGIRDVLGPDADPGDVAAVVRRAATLAAAHEEAGQHAATQADDHRVIVVASPQGGAGKTTVATNLAVGLARAAVGSTVLVDLDVQFGDVAGALAMTPEYTLPDTVQGAASYDPLVLKTFLGRHPSGLHVLAGSDSPAAGDAVTADQVGRLLDTLGREFRYVVVDTAPGLTAHTLTALEQATDLVLVSRLDVPGVRGMRKELDVLTELHLLPAARHLVLNAVESAGGLSTTDVEDTLGAPLDVVLPRHSAVPVSTNTGVPLLHGDNRDPVTRGLQAMVAGFLPTPIDRRGGLFGRRRVASR
ncbi:MAG: flpE [Modestobacter sp.]|nr:flpE [Modestobacter sp.]